MNERDIFDALQQADPAGRIDPADAARIKARVHARVLAQVSPRLGRRRLLVAVAVAVLALASVTDETTDRRRRPDTPRCGHRGGAVAYL